MASEKMGRPGLNPVYRSATRSHAAADAETFKLLAGRPKWLYEMASGAVGGDVLHEPTASLNPMGRLGHDHSGPPYGSAIQHPLFTHGSSRSESHFTIDDGTTEYVPFMLISPTTADQDGAVFVAEFYVRPFPEYNYNGTVSPYSRGYLNCLALLSGAGTVTLTAELWTVHGDMISTSSDTASITSTVSPGEMVEFRSAYWNLTPGVNKCYCKLTHDSATLSMIIGSVSGNQIVKRSH